MEKKKSGHSLQQFKKMIHDMVKESFQQGTKTSVWLLKLLVPVSFAVFLCDYFGLLALLGKLTGPFFSVIGLSGEAAIILITSYFANLYSAIAVMVTLDLDFREGLILANMCLIAHALVVETAIQKKTGSSAWRMVVLRLTASFLAAWLLHLVMPGFTERIGNGGTKAEPGFSHAFTGWLGSIALTSLKIVVLVNLLLMLQKILQRLGVLGWLVKPLYPFLKVMGLPQQTGFLWLIANTLGLSYGGAIMINQTSQGELKRSDADLLNHHIGISHSLLEDTLLFAAIGLSIPWLMVPRVILAIAAVWLRKLELNMRSFFTTNSGYPGKNKFN